MQTLTDRLADSDGALDDELVHLRREELASEQPVPYCCAAASGVRVVFPDAGPGSGPPVWASVSEHRYLGSSSHPVSFCPFCGVRLPGLVLKAVPPSPVRVSDFGRARCSTCGESGTRCLCCSPESLWEAEGAPPVFAAVCLLQAHDVSPGSVPGTRFLSVSRKGRPSEKGLPGGRVEEGESPEQAARRELLEETGYAAGHMHKVFDAVDDAGVRVVAFRVESWTAPSSPVLADGESGTVEWVPMRDLTGSSPFASFNSALFSLLGARSA